MTARERKQHFQQTDSAHAGRPWAAWLMLAGVALATAVASGSAHAATGGMGESIPTDVTADDHAGLVELTEGDVQIIDRAYKARVVAVGTAAMEGDTIVTGHDGEVHLAMADGGILAVRPDTRLTLTHYRAEGDAADISLINLTVGAVRSITGWIGRYNRSRYAIRTPTATIGVRGTDHEPMVIAPGDADDEPGTYDKVNIGSTYIETKQGRVEVPAGRAAFSPQSRKRGQIRPRLLDRIPKRYRPARHEDKLEQRHERVQEKLQQIREERIKKLRERPDREARTEARSAQQARADKRLREERARRSERSAEAEHKRAERSQRPARTERESGRRERLDERGDRGNRGDRDKRGDPAKGGQHESGSDDPS